MGQRIPGHGDCLVCHPDLDRKVAKSSTKGSWHIKPSIRRRLQEKVSDLIETESFVPIV